MSIRYHGICSSCNRTTFISDPDNKWCERCLVPEERARVSRSRMFVGFFWLFAAVIYLALVLRIFS